MTIKEGWRGRFYEDFTVGDVYQHPLGRTVTTTDNLWFTLLTQNTAPIHFDHHYAAQTAFGKPLVDSTFTLALVTGQSVSDISQNVFANLGWDEVRLPHPVFPGLPPASLSNDPMHGSRLFEGVAQMLLALAAERPVVVAIDDLQWCDDDSCSLLLFLTRRL